MEEQEKLRLKKLYEQMPEGKLIEVILEDEEEYKKQPYEAYKLLLEEAKRRGFEKKINEKKKINYEHRMTEGLDSETETKETKDWITIHNFFDILEAQQLEQILKEHNIPVAIISRQDSAFDGLFKSSIGEGVLQVRKDCVKEAKKILADFKKIRKQKDENTKKELGNGTVTRKRPIVYTAVAWLCLALFWGIPISIGIGIIIGLIYLVIFR